MRIPVEQRRAALAEAALRVVARDGVAAATTRAIVAEAGMSLASFHYAYRSRDEVFREVVALVVAGERDAMASVLAEAESTPPADLAQLLRRGLGAYVETFRAAPGREQGMLELTFLALRSGELEGVAAAQYAQYRGLVVEMLEAAAAVTGMRWTTPTDDLARAIVAVTDGLTVAGLVEPGADLELVLDLLAPALAARAEPTTKPAAPERTPA